MRKIHVLPGDAIAEDFHRAELEGEVIICRESLIEGDLLPESLDDFWRARAEFFEREYGADENSYAEKVVAEFEKLRHSDAGCQINLWFEYELFCQANMWFCLWLLSDKNVEIYRVAPTLRSENDLWKGFGNLNAEDLQSCFGRRVKFGDADVQLGRQLWTAFRGRDFESLRLLSETESVCFPYLKQVCEAANEMKTRPKKTLAEIAADGEADFDKIFAAFTARAGVYGFGDAQVKRLMREI